MGLQNFSLSFICPSPQILARILRQHHPSLQRVTDWEPGPDLSPPWQQLQTFPFPAPNIWFFFRGFGTQHIKYTFNLDPLGVYLQNIYSCSLSLVPRTSLPPLFKQNQHCVIFDKDHPGAAIHPDTCRLGRVLCCGARLSDVIGPLSASQTAKHPQIPQAAPGPRWDVRTA